MKDDLLFLNLEESESENCTKVIQNFCIENLRLIEAENFEFENVYRFVKSRNSKGRPILAKFKNVSHCTTRPAGLVDLHRQYLYCARLAGWFQPLAATESRSAFCLGFNAPVRLRAPRYGELQSRPFCALFAFVAGGVVGESTTGGWLSGTQWSEDRAWYTRIHFGRFREIQGLRLSCCIILKSQRWGKHTQCPTWLDRLFPA